jgi:hypothetical protein
MCFRHRPIPLSGPIDWHRPGVQAQIGIGDEEIGVERELVAEPIAPGAHPVRAIEAEELRRRRFVTDAAMGASVMRGKEDIGRASVGQGIWGVRFGGSVGASTRSQ